MAAAYVQGKSASGTAASFTLTLTSNVTAGNVIAVAVQVISSTVTLSSIASASRVSGGFTILQTDTSYSSSKGYIAYGIVTSSGSCVITFTLSASASAGAIAHEISGVSASPLDVDAMLYNGYGTTVSSGSVTTTAAGDYVFGVGFDCGAMGATFTHGTGFTARIDLAEYCHTEDEIQSAAGAITAAYSVSANGYYAGAIIAFKAASTGNQYTSTPTASMSAFSGAIARLDAKGISSAMSTFAGGMNRLGAKGVAASLSAFGGAVNKRGAKSLAASMSAMAGALARITGKTLSAQLQAFSVNSVRSVVKSFASALSFAAQIGKQTEKLIAAAMNGWVAVLAAFATGFEVACQHAYGVPGRQKAFEMPGRERNFELAGRARAFKLPGRQRIFET